MATHAHQLDNLLLDYVLRLIGRVLVLVLVAENSHGIKVDFNNLVLRRRANVIGHLEAVRVCLVKPCVDMVE